MTDRQSDEELLALIGWGDAKAIRLMIQRKLPRLLALAVRMIGDKGDAEDVVQEAFLRVWQQASSWRSGDASFDTWLYRVTLNLCYDRLRKRREQPDGQSARGGG